MSWEWAQDIQKRLELDFEAREVAILQRMFEGTTPINLSLNADISYLRSIPHLHCDFFGTKWSVNIAK